MKTLIALPTLALLTLTSCTSGIVAGITGQPVPTVTVARIPDGPTALPTPAFEIAAADVAQAESQPQTVWGMYNAGQVADFASQVFDLSKFTSSK